MHEHRELVVGRGNPGLVQVRGATSASTPIAAGEVDVTVEAFALTTNNVTYAAFGEQLRYFDFFPTGGA